MFISSDPPCTEGNAGFIGYPVQLRLQKTPFYLLFVEQIAVKLECTLAYSVNLTQLT